MKHFDQSWKLGQLEFHLVCGDIFKIPVQAIVNSEQTDFVLSWNPKTISGQIAKRYNSLVQPELNQQTKGQILQVGTVLKTRGGDDYVCIYHAGFHHPWIYPDLSSDENSQTEHLAIIRSCIHRILDDVGQSPVSSIAFPLIGTGVFRLDPALLAYEFMAEVASFVDDTDLRDKKIIYLVISEDKNEQLSKVLDACNQALIDHYSPTYKHEPFSLGVDYLNRFEIKVARSRHPQWSAWLMVRYCELITEFLFYNLAVANNPPIHPMKFTEADRPVSFGTIREKAISLVKSKNFQKPMDEWTKFFYRAN